MAFAKLIETSATAPAPTAATTENPNLIKLRTDLQTSIEKIVADFSVKYLNYAAVNQNKPPVGTAAPTATGAPQPATSNAFVPKYKSLPWFKHGVKHFLNKLWHGDHPSNPSWQGVQRIEHRLNLQEYTTIKQGISNFCYDFFEEADSELQAIINQLIADLTHTTADYFNKAYELGKTGTIEQTPSASPQATATTPVEEPAQEEPAPAAEEPPVEKRKLRRSKKVQQPEEVPTEIPSEEEPSTVLSLEEFSDEMANALRNGGDPELVTNLAAKAGIKLGKGAKGITDLPSAEKIVRMMYKLGRSHPDVVARSVWNQSPKYKDALPQLKIWHRTLDDAITNVANEIYEQNKTSQTAPELTGHRPKVFGAKGAVGNETPVASEAFENKTLKHRIQLLKEQL